MSILVTGATGFLGKKVCEHLSASGHAIYALSRNAKLAKEKLPFAKIITPQELSTLKKLPITTVINLMGENIGEGRWTSRKKAQMIHSRVEGTRHLLKHLPDTVTHLIQASAIGIYPANSDNVLTEENALTSTSDFLPQLCIDWENACQTSSIAHKTILRLGVILGEESGALKKLAPIFKLGLGGPIGFGKGMMSWIELNDAARLFKHVFENKLYGVYNAVAPKPCSNLQFTKALAKRLHRPALFPVPPLALKLAFGEMSSIILDSQTVSSQKIQAMGFSFQCPTIERALEKIYP